jgi:hypothetical protein
VPSAFHHGPAVPGSRYPVVSPVQPSDRRLKKNIAKVKNPLQKVLRLKGVYYNWVENTGRKLSQERQLGFIAQDVQDVVPEVIETSQDGKTLAINYGALIAVVVEAVRDLHEKILSIEKSIAELKESQTKAKSSEKETSVVGDVNEYRRWKDLMKKYEKEEKIRNEESKRNLRPIIIKT